MAVYIPITLVAHGPDAVTYAYSQPIYEAHPTRAGRRVEVGHHVGQLTLDKTTGTVTQLSGEDWDPKGVIFLRAAAKVIRNHREGLYPASSAYEA